MVRNENMEKKLAVLNEEKENNFLEKLFKKNERMKSIIFYELRCNNQK